MQTALDRCITLPAMEVSNIFILPICIVPTIKDILLYYIHFFENVLYICPLSSSHSLQQKRRRVRKILCLIVNINIKCRIFYAYIDYALSNRNLSYFHTYLSNSCTEYSFPCDNHPILGTDHPNPCSDDPILYTNYWYPCSGLVELVLVQPFLVGVACLLWHGT